VQTWDGAAIAAISGNTCRRVGIDSAAPAAYIHAQGTMVEPQTVKERLQAAFPNASQIEVEDLTGTKDHYRAVIVDAGFAGISRIEQHKLVYKALGELMAGPVHALALETRAG
jgi:stress-induced morphogen